MAQKKPDIAPPSIFVIFGAGGDLAKRKLFPALCNLNREGLLPEGFAVVAITHQPISDEDYRDYLKKELPEVTSGDFCCQQWETFRSHIFATALDFNEPSGYLELGEVLRRVGAQFAIPANYLFYLATPPRFFGPIAAQLRGAGLTEEGDGVWRRVIIEKPFGQDLESARVLNRLLHANLEEHQIYRIDHYLGKETVQNILAYRFTNSTVEPIWDHRYIDHVQITVAESVGVENRANYYDATGALRDMIPNHLLAVLSVVAMEPPNSFDADAVRDEQTKVLRAIRPFTPEDVLTQTVRGQYGPGKLGGREVAGYRQEPGVDTDSKTETYVALKVLIDSWRWVGVPFYIRTGKRMPGRYTEVAVVYKHAPNAMFRDSSFGHRDLPANMLVLRLQPREGIDMTFNAKVPGHRMKLGTVTMEFHYEDHFGSEPTTGYETLLFDCMNGDATLFKRADNIEIGWEIVEPILDVWSALPTRNFPNYEAGSWGPKEADELLERDGRRWKDCGIDCNT
jgi:glucose-6-phosphate 1-dehydrogenase